MGSLFLRGSHDENSKSARQKKEVLNIPAGSLLGGICRSTYVPFTGQIFRLKAGEVESVRITNGSTGVTCNYAEGEEGFSDLLDTLNSLRYWAWIPDPPVARGGYEYVLWIQTGGESVGFQFTSRSILVRGIWYQVRGPQLGRLAELVEK